MKIKMLSGEKWWGGTVRHAKAMPFDEKTTITINLQKDIWTQTASLFLSNFGRIIWCEEPFSITFNGGTIECFDAENIIVEVGGKTLREGYLTAMKKYFPFEKNVSIPRDFVK